MINLGFRVLIGYYIPKSDGEFYQFCYVTHAGDIRGASTPFQFRVSTPTEDLLTVTEDDSNSDILVVTTKTGLLEVHQAPVTLCPRYSQCSTITHDPPLLSLPHLKACGGSATGAQGAAEGHAPPAGGEAAAAGGAEAAVQGEGAGEGDVLPAADTQPGETRAQVSSGHGQSYKQCYKIKSYSSPLLLASTLVPTG